MELICPTGTLAALRGVLDAGVRAVQCGFADETNANQLRAPHFGRSAMAEAIATAHARGARVIVAIDSYMRAGREDLWTSAVDIAVSEGADAILVSDIGLLAYMADKYPARRRHLALQLSACSAPHIEFLAEAFGIRRAALPRGLLVEEVLQIARGTDCEIEVSSSGMQTRRPGQTGPSLDMLAHLDALSEAGVAALTLQEVPAGDCTSALLSRIEAVGRGVERAA